LSRIFASNCLKKFIIQKKKNSEDTKSLNYFTKTKNNFSNNSKFKLADSRESVSGSKSSNKKINNKFGF
jgi:hypothetical protein